MMLTSKQLKLKYKSKFQDEYKKYYPVNYLKNEGFIRNKCKNCGKPFWNTNQNQEFCGDSTCSGGFRFIGNSPAKNKLDYIETWKAFSSMFKKFGYTPINRYPVVSRWREDIYFVEASIDDFIPYVISGQVEPPANPLVVPQLCLRFNDIDNVGISGSHNTLFSMVGQHQFVPKKEWNQEKVFSEIHQWLKKGLGLPNEEITFHEDIWAGSNRFGPCMEFFSRGLEIGNQVYMLYEHTQGGDKELPIKVLDMGMGQERCSWFSQGCSTIYDAAFPNVMNKLYQKTGIKVDKNIQRKFIPYAGYLNIDEIEDIEKAWRLVAKKVDLHVDELKNHILPLSALYSIGEHARALLVALNDSALPSNTGGGYNLRLLARRCFSFIEKYKWNIYLPEICEEHAKELKPLFPELTENIEQIKKILDIEKIKFEATKQKSKQIVQKLISQDIKEKDLLHLYDSYGIPPEIIKQESENIGKIIKIPDNFYAKVSELHEKQEQIHATKKEEKLNLKNISETELLFYKNEKQVEFEAKALKIIDNNVILDKTCFYGTSGGQLHDIGFLNTNEVIDVFKQNNIIIHVLKNKPDFKVNSKVKGKINWERRYQLMQHHTTTHIINAAARKVLGNHINQAGAFKDIDKARIDITHYEPLSQEQIKEIEKAANEIVNKKIKIIKSFIPRTEAEQKYGLLIYQGGVPIGKTLRIVNIQGIDVEACSGTHLDNTSEAGFIKIIKSNKISDSIVRIEFKSGKAALSELNKESSLLDETALILNCSKDQVPGRAQELFEKWKKVVKKKLFAKEDLILTSTKKDLGTDDELLKKTAIIFKTQPEFVPKTAKRFLEEIKSRKN